MADLKGKRSAFGYSKTGDLASEPTSIAGLALLPHPNMRPLALEAAKFLTTMQQRDGSVGLFAHLDKPKWPTSLSLLLWSSLPEIENDHKNRAVDWLLKAEGVTFPDAKGRDHDNSIPGWPWYEENYSWVEPTCYALLALHKVGQSTHKRSVDGFRLLVDRALPAGGWNYGSVSLHGRPLRPQIATSGIALLTLALSPETPPSALIDKACHYLQNALLKIQTPKSMSWAILGLRAWNRLPSNCDELLSNCWRKYGAKSENGLEVALFALAAYPESLRYIGVKKAVGE